MAVDAATLVIPVKSNAEQTTRDFKKLDNQLEKTNKSADGTSKALRALKGIGIAALVATAARAVGKFASETVKLASAAEETRNKFAVTFRGIQREAQTAAENLAENFGLAQSQAQQLLADTGDLLTGFGFTRESALELSTSVQELAVDLASFTNFAGGAEGASQALTKALLGERESIKSLGIAITEADIARLAEEKGIAGELDRQTKAALTLELAIRQSGNAIGDFERSSASFANQIRIAESRIRDTKEAIGAALLPFANLAVTTFNNLSGGLKDAANNFATFVTSAEGAARIGNIIGKIAGAFAVLQEFLRPVAELIGEGLKMAFEAVGDLFKNFRREGENTGTVFLILGGAIAGITGAFDVFKTVIAETITTIGNFVAAVRASAEAVGAAFRVFSKEVTLDDVRDEFREAGEAFKTFGEGFVSGIVNIGEVAADAFGDFGAQAQEQADRLEGIFEEASARAAASVSTTLEAAGAATVDAIDEASIRAEEARTEELRRQEEAAREAARIEEELAARRLQINEETNRALLEQAGDRIGILKLEREQRIAEAEAVGASLLGIEIFYATEIARAQEEIAQEAAEKQKEINEQVISSLRDIWTEFTGLLDNLADLRITKLEAEAEALDQQTEERLANIDEQIAGLEDLGLTEEELAAETERLENKKVDVREKADTAIARIERDIAEREKKARIFSAIISTAAGVARAFADYPFPASAIIAGIVAAAGAVEIATIQAEPLPAAQFGGSFEVPPGLGDDAGLLRISSGEEVDVTPARQAGGGGMPSTVVVRIGDRDFTAAVEDAFNKNGGQIRRASAIRTN